MASSAITLVTLTGAVSAVWVAYCAGQEKQLDTALTRQADLDAREASYSAVAGPSLRSGRDLAVTFEALYGADAKALAWTPNLEPARPRLADVRQRERPISDLWWNNEHLRATIVPVPGPSARWLWLASSRADLDDDARDLARKMAIAVFVAVSASALAAWWLGGMLTREHARIAAVARAVAAGDLSARVGARARDPETARLARDIDEMISRLAVLLDAQERFIANASHELRAPVTTMLGELSFALHRDRDAPWYRAAIEEALASARRLKALTEDLLALARMGSREFEPEPVPLSEAVRAALDATRTAAEATGVTLETACEGAVVNGHPGDLERLVRNLVENAVRHSPRGGRVRIEAGPSPDGVEVAISDEGPGVAPELRERIFEPFFRSAAARADEGGAGLGLAIARGIARAHGGDLWLDTSCHGPGARFVVRFPVAGMAG